MDMGLGGLQELVMDKEPGMLQFMGSQRFGHNWATELNWTESYYYLQKRNIGNYIMVTTENAYCLRTYWYFWVAIKLDAVQSYYFCVCSCSVASVICAFETRDCSSPGSCIHGIFQARILEQVAISFSKGSSLPRDWTLVLCFLHRQVDSLPLHHLGSPKKARSDCN